MTMKKLTRNETADFLLKNDNYAILTHRRPDGDTIGSSAALCRILRKLGKTAHVIRNAEVSDRFAWLHEGLTKEETAEDDVIVTVDVASPGMLPKQFEQYLGKIALRIDHHASASSFTASCAIVVFCKFPSSKPALHAVMLIAAEKPRIKARLRIHFFFITILLSCTVHLSTIAEEPHHFHRD